MPGALHKVSVYLGLRDEPYARATQPAYAHAADRSFDRAPEPQYAHAGVGYAPDVDDQEGWSEQTYEEFAEIDAPSYRITTLHPRTYNEARTIGEHYRSGTPVIMNLTEMEDADAKRLVDFSAGLTFGLHGRLERVTAKVFLLSPKNVTVTAQDKQRIVESGFFNQS